MMQARAYIGLGGNLGDPLSTLQGALAAIANLRDTQVMQTSSFYQSKPLGPADQPDYINAVALITTILTPLGLLEALQEIENDFGRERIRRWGERTLDLDILLYDNLVQSSSRLTIPHPGLMQREFVAVPLAEIAPQLVLPNGRPIRDVCNNLPAHELHCVLQQHELEQQAPASRKRMDIPTAD